MKIKIICIGKLKEKYWMQAVAEYLKRIGRFAKVEVIELRETRISDKPSAAEEESVKKSEGEEILKKIKRDDYCITLEIKGKQLSSEEFAGKLAALAIEGKSSIAFVIGGSLGLSQDVSMRADFKLSFSPMTFTHQMMRVVLLEQIYRCFKINNNETYHK